MRELEDAIDAAAGASEAAEEAWVGRQAEWEARERQLGALAAALRGELAAAAPAAAAPLGLDLDLQLPRGPHAVPRLHHLAGASGVAAH